MSARSRAAVVLIAAVLSVGVTARMGFWQLDRAAQKAALQASLDTRSALPPLDVATLARDAAGAAAQFDRRIEVQGHWRSDATVYLENRQMNGRPGFFVVTPLQLDAGGAVLVQRGWVPRDAVDRTRLAPVVTPIGPVSVEGRVAPLPGRLYEFEAAVGASPATARTSIAPSSGSAGAIRQNLDLDALARQTGLALRPLSIVQVDAVTAAGSTAAAPADGLLRQWSRPAVGIHTHYGYAVQWFALSALMAGLYVWFQLLRPRFRRTG